VANFAGLFVRLIVVGIGFFLAALAAGVAWIFLSRLIVPEDFGTIGDFELTVTLVVGTLGVSAVMARAVAIPAFVLIAIMEFGRFRDWLAYALSGAALALAASAMPVAAGAAFSASGLAVNVACGMIAGLVYWAIAGRSAGAWLPRSRREAAGDEVS
jgi:hypothetical protein